MRILLLLLPAALSACSDSRGVDEVIVNSGQAGNPRAAAPRPAATLDPGTVAVTVGDGGPGFPACQTTGLVIRTDRLTVRRAPFLEGAVADELPDGARVAICARSHDRRWLGVVYTPAPASPPAPAAGIVAEPPVTPAATCGVARPVQRRQAYDGPCRSGWIDSAFVRVVSE